MPNIQTDEDPEFTSQPAGSPQYAPVVALGAVPLLATCSICGAAVGEKTQGLHTEWHRKGGQRGNG